ncbi:MAG: DNA polymerase III subunit gamma/tau [Candidatus Sulfobium sp.]
MSYLVLARKWRPREFDDLVGQEPIMRILKNAVSQGKIAHAYLFSGPRGVGKTSSARILSKALNCKEGPTPVPCGVCESCTAIADGSSVDVMEIDGASNNSVDDIRDLRERVRYAPSSGRYKVYIIDEVHMLSGSAFNALLKTLEEPPSHVIFVLATTEMRKIPATVVSRCQHMPFRRIPSGAIRDRLGKVSESEGIKVSPRALGLIARAADGSMRDSLTILDQLSSFSSEVSEEDVRGLLGIADLGLLSKVSKALIAGERVELLKAVEILTEQGADIRAFTKGLVQFFRDLLVASVMRRSDEVLDLGAEEMAAVKEIAAMSSEDQLTLVLSEMMKAENDVRTSSSPRLALELSLLKASFLSTMKPLKDVIENISRHGVKCTGGLSSVVPEDVREAEDTNEQEEREHGGRPVMEAQGQPKAAGSPSGDGDAKDKAEEEDASGAWERTIARLDPRLSSQLGQAEVELRGNELSLTLNGGHATLFGDSIKNNLEAIGKVVKDEYGRDISVRFAVAQKKKQKVMNEPLIKEVLELFGGRIVDVSPAGDPVNKQNGGKYV